MMNNNTKSCGFDRLGAALITAVFMVAIVMVIAIGISFVLYSEILGSGRTASTTKALFAAEGAQEYARILLDSALQNFSVPAHLQSGDIDQYAADALSGSRTGDRDIGVLVDFCPAFEQFMPRGEMGVLSGEIGQGQSKTKFELAFDFWPTGVDEPEPSDPTGAYVFHYDYEITSKGDMPSGTITAEQVTQLTGSLEVTVFHPSFSFYDFFTVVMKTPAGQQIYFANNEVLDGPVYVGSKPGFAGNDAGGGPTFTDQFQTTWASWDTAEKIYNPVVKWNEEYPALWGVDEIPVPGNSFSQSRAAMGDYADVSDTTKPVTHAERRENLGLTPGTSAPPAGVYYAKGDGVDNIGNDTNELLGGIYIYGDVQNMDLAAVGSTQVIRIQQGGQWTEIVIDNAAGTMTVTEPGDPPRVFNDVPNGVIHVEGTLDNLGRASGASAAIEENSMMTISAQNSIYVDNHLNYEVDPTVDPDARNVLGLVAGSGNVLVTDNAPSNLRLDATIFATAAGKGFGVENYKYKPASGALNLFGGVIMDSYQAIGTFSSTGPKSGYYKNFHYDRRFLEGSFAPPFFPTVQTYVGRLRSLNRTDWGQVVPEEPED
jgi:hypothetical protein